MSSAYVTGEAVVHLDEFDAEDILKEALNIIENDKEVGDYYKEIKAIAREIGQPTPEEQGFPPASTAASIRSPGHLKEYLKEEEEKGNG